MRIVDHLDGIGTPNAVRFGNLTPEVGVWPKIRDCPDTDHMIMGSRDQILSRSVPGDFQEPLFMALSVSTDDDSRRLVRVGVSSQVPDPDAVIHARARHDPGIQGVRGEVVDNSNAVAAECCKETSGQGVQDLYLSAGAGHA